MQISLFTPEYREGAYRRAFNPYLQIGSFEICIDRDGACIHTARRSFGYIRKSGFWSHRVGS